DAEERLIGETALIDLRGQFTLPQVAGALQATKACVTIDNGIMHLAYSVGTPTIALFGASPWQLWTPQNPALDLVLPATPCSMCRDNRFENEGCIRDTHICMESITPELVFERLKRSLRVH